MTQEKKPKVKVIKQLQEEDANPPVGEVANPFNLNIKKLQSAAKKAEVKPPSYKEESKSTAGEAVITEFKPYHINFGNKYKGKSYDEVKNEKKYVDFLRRTTMRSKAIDHFVNWCDKQEMQ